MLTVSLVEDDDTYRELMCRYISGTHGLRLASAYATAEEALQRFSREKPDVALVDIKLPGMNGIECVRRLRQIVPALSTHFIILTAHEDSNLIFDSLRAGAHGFLLKENTVRKNLLASIKEVVVGGCLFTLGLARKVIAHFEGQPKPTIRLTEKEWNVLRDLAEGLSYKEIAGKLSISLDTVRKRIRAIYDKLHVHSRMNAIKFVQDQPSPPPDRTKK